MSVLRRHVRRVLIRHSAELFAYARGVLPEVSEASHATEEQVVLVDAAGRAIGTAPKLTVHTLDTPLHLGFSCYVFDHEGRVLLTRRAAHKITWPDAWTNTCCGHPAPGEPAHAAVVRRLDFELGLAVDEPDLILPGFSYRAVMTNGTMERELCPVFRAVTRASPRPNPDEVGETQWVPWDRFAESVMSGERQIPPWCREQAPRLAALGADPLAWPRADSVDLPPAAR
jgi:isopentenyl-diphosphate delta-isomerase